jgi:hypothetical protein
MARRVALLTAAALASSASAATLVQTPAGDPAAVTLSGRVLRTPSSGVQMDWEGTTLRFTVAAATVVALNISDASAGGARLGVTVDGAGVPGLRAATLITSPAQAVYTLAGGKTIAGATVTYAVTLLTEPAFVSDSATGGLVVEGILTDGKVGPAPPAPSRRIEFLGDSLTAGYGAGFDLPTPTTTCGGNVLTNDVQMDYSWRLCAAFGADCAVVAWSGITLYVGNPNLPSRYPWTLGGQPGAHAYDFKVGPFDSRGPPDAIVINLGEVRSLLL